MAEEVAYDGGDSPVLSSWRVDGNGILVEGDYKEGSLLGKNATGELEFTTDATKAEAILLEAIVVPAGKTSNAPILQGGVYAEDALVLGGVLTLDDVLVTLRDKNLYIKKRG